MRFVFSILLLYCASQVSAQGISKPLDTNYLEDQFYVGITYNFVRNKPNDITQRNLSYGLQGGLVRDFPINRSRTRAFGLGLGYAVNSYYSNMKAEEINGVITYSPVGSNVDLKRSKIENHLIELPIEYRWRNSTLEEYKFWRIYTGVKLGYVFASRSKFVTESEKISFSNGDVRQFQYGLTFSFGWNTFNAHVYYALSSIFKDDITIDGEPIEMKPLRVGFIFYIL
ncbi:porin family protein [Maribacter algicola]|uniref:Porin family protein n=1 Tax=Meishania litoralis TaxID=3434685 RepID=A0ACC7LGZ2_9FLAO